jgi:hypothetical protein
VAWSSLAATSTAIVPRTLAPAAGALIAIDGAFKSSFNLAKGASLARINEMNPTRPKGMAIEKNAITIVRVARGKVRLGDKIPSSFVKDTLDKLQYFYHKSL